jgi:hypothetical protein
MVVECNKEVEEKGDGDAVEGIDEELHERRGVTGLAACLRRDNVGLEFICLCSVRGPCH